MINLIKIIVASILGSISLCAQTNLDTPKNINIVADRLKNNTIVALGEGTHGTKEFNIIRSEISKKLINDYNFTIIAFENSYGDSYFLNEGINSEKNLDSIMKDNILSVWQTEEIKDLFLWIRNYNKKHRKKIIVTGFDTNLLSKNVDILAKDTVSSLLKNKDILKNITLLIDNSWLRSNDSLFNPNYEKIIEEGIKGYNLIKKIKDEEYYNKLSLNTKLALYNLELGFRTYYEINNKNESYSRDYIMSNMIKTIQKETNKKIILFAHNTHIALKPNIVNGVGEFLRQEYSNKYYALATLTYRGNYSAMIDNVDTKNNSYNSYKLPDVLKDSWEEHLYKNFSLNNFYIDLRQDVLPFFNNEYKMRFLGYKYYEKKDDKYIISKPFKLANYFDGIIFIKSSNASEHL